MEEVDYKKKIKQCEKLGATTFQKVVFKVEEIKFKAIKKFFPKYLEWYDKFCDKFRDKKLKKATTELERKTIINTYRNQKLMMRKEFHREQNRNYHMDKNKPTEILNYLQWNKKVHVRGMIKNSIAIPCLAVAAGFGIAPFVTIPFLIAELGGLFINFQCVNIQNYNIYRYKQHEEQMKKLEARRTKRNIEKYSEAGAVITRSLRKTDDIPTFTEIIDNIETQEELEQLKALVKANLGSKQETEKNNVKTNKLGGK